MKSTDDIYDSRLRSVLLKQEIGYLKRTRNLFLIGFAIGILIGFAFGQLTA